MCIICVSTISIASLLAPTQPTADISINQTALVKIESVREYNSVKEQEYKFTNKSCSKLNLNKEKKNTICLKKGKVYKWAVKKPIFKKEVVKTDIDLTLAQSSVPAKNNIPVVDNVEIYNLPSEQSDNVELCKIKESNSNRERWLNSQLPTGFPGFTHATKTGTVKWALIPIDFPDIQGQSNFMSRVEDQMKLLSDWFNMVSEGKFKIEWVVADKWVTLPNLSSQYVVNKSLNLGNSSNGSKLFKEAMFAADPVFDFTGIQTVNFILPQGQTFIQETSQGFPWDQAIKDVTTTEGSISSFSIPGVFFDHPKSQYWSYWAHEFGHAMALPHIGSSREPNAFMGLDIMGNQDGESKELSGWMRFVSGWLDDNKVYCKQLSNLKNINITLNPLNEIGNGLKMVVIPVSETKAVVIESRRETKFSCQMPSKRNGVLVYTYDATLSHGEDFLKPITPTGRMAESSFDCRVVPYPNPIIYEGQHIIIDGIKVELLKSSNYDKLKISKF
jgi:M6 family metalloprotease-like protein